MAEKRIRVLAVASGGGHWVQLRRLAPAFEGCDVTYVTTEPGYRDEVAPARFFRINDASRWNKPAVVLAALRMFLIVLRVRPNVVISTGAAPGYLALRLGGFLGARTMWVDSIANAEELSMSGRMAGKIADAWLTQWPHLAKESGPRCEGAVL